ncbi:isoleucine--tRNA ligase [Seleniivibrio woodruffii]|uniref:Isoleucine--tRNA ligase n=1 Tax=Seleniivibrio woodruffii TaxID=1078050 RepID=A0A4V2PRX7_9BACT|nr:isoleucine--tRNA ligase [Seleniivibrio woodruffii]TCK60521.1 isoleucyl-tRNA synthetase [Seleniivibrio woodruffii]TVZ36149.1 isoleucyl-tRNA synthetase [Seleniivibrio woodruffii]
MDYKDTLNLPQTDFPMKASLTVKEPERLKKWADEKAYEKMLASRDRNNPYILHDGPPYANGEIHIGHALNKILKDIIVKMKSFEGYYTPYVPGWDCHGLPIELQVDKKLGSKKHEMSKSEIRKECRKYADRFIDLQRQGFIRLGGFGDWYNPYITMDYKYEAKTLQELYRFFDNGGVFKGLKPVYWCTSCVTALAEAEVEYDNHTSTSVFVKFPMQNQSKGKFGLADGDKVSAVIWTTTPWTLPANLGICANADIEYSIIKVTDTCNKNLSAGEYLIVATDLVNSLNETFHIHGFETYKVFKGAELEYVEFKHAFYDRLSLGTLGDHVTLDAGTGLVHTAPGHGQEDYEVGLRYGLEILNPVDDRGCYKRNVEIFAEQSIYKAGKLIVEMMDEQGSLLQSGEINHSYPHCWRCKHPVIFRATPQWFIGMENNDLRKKTLSEIKKVRWTPAWGENRITAMIENRPDWCISRQRTWGVPIAVFLCEDCDSVVINKQIQERVLDAFREEGADAWFDHDNSAFIPEGTKCPGCGGTHFKKETDILDVWFDSGTSHSAVLEERGELSWPADMYLEGSDQHRGWFHSSILESVGTRGIAPYKEVLTHGFVVDGKGRKMSKSVGNVVSPSEIINKYGAEVLRLWVSAEDYSEDIRISDDIINRLVESYRKIRNTARYLLGNLYDFNPDTDMVEFKEMLDLDRFALARWQSVKKRIFEAYDRYQLHVFYHSFLNFCINDLSSFYLDILKDRLYAYKPASRERRSAQTAMYIILKEMSVVMAPVLSFTADEIYEYMPASSSKKENIFMELFAPAEDYDDAENIAKWTKILEVRKEATKALEVARAAKIIGHPLDADIVIGVDDDTKKFLVADEGIERIFIVSEVSFADPAAMTDCHVSEDGKVKVKVIPSENGKCERCWTKSSTIGHDASHPTLCKRCAEALA